MAPSADTVEGVIKSAFVIQQVEACVEIAAVIMFSVNFGYEYEVGEFGLHGCDKAAEFLRVHEFDHVAPEPVHSPSGPEPEDFQHSVPGLRRIPIVLPCVGPVAVAIVIMHNPALIVARDMIRDIVDQQFQARGMSPSDQA